ncbi:LysR substrate-binding domain-containing protein [Novosphingobium sp.]|uniref:LysR substrate-binding domain-containing protein n=1 Tax=Novosphingobium sp. TaxID=1874826 RepID=UPI0025CE5EED|nr:LysR substrate-binding domain-containing protein [Novosphingobium sp.]MCC6924231.1 LysR family transcriptional regulator [Novosphingobium sp.]
MAGKIDLRRLPPLKALRGFEAATRHQSIRDAAEELCLTHPAVSHQVQLIEEALGIALFAQEGRHIVSTEEGRVLYPYVRSAFESLLEGVEAAQRHALDKPLRIQTYITASIRWLAKRVPQFMEQHPEVKLTLATCAVEWEFDDKHADVGLVYCESPPDPAQFHWQPVFDYTLYTVCSPQFLAEHGGELTVAELMAKPLIAITTEEQNWEGWFASAGLEFAPQIPSIMVDTCAMALEMALAGRGVALINGPFAEGELADGSLVMPVPHREVCPGSWGLICRRDMRDNVRVKTFIDWVADHASPG